MTDPTPSTPPPTDEYVTFIQNQLPGLEDGDYQLDIGQYVNDSDHQRISGDALSRSYTFAVLGDRFRLSNPAATVASTFPASNDTGEFSTVLPHVVFTSPSFPWARAPQYPPGKDAEGDVPTWLAVLVLDDDDAAAYPTLGLPAVTATPGDGSAPVTATPGDRLTPVTATLGDLFPPGAYGHTTLGENYSYFTGATDTSGLQVGQQVTDPVQTIDIPLGLLADIAPTLGDLELTAHVRRLSVQNKPMALGAQPPADPIGTFAIVVGNRLPQPAKQSHAYLVSLESLAGFLPTTSDGGTLTTSGLDMTKSLRLAVLLHWTFFTKQDESAAFVDRLEQLNGRTITKVSGQTVYGPDAANTNLRLTAPGASPPISTALDSGYVPLDHDLRTTESTVSWYRGPLSPIDRTPAGITLPISSPDQALVFDPTTGMFDASLAAAWTIGRLVALQDQSYASSLYAWKKGLTQAVVDSVERTIIDEVFGDLLAPPPATQPPATQPPTAQAAAPAAPASTRTLLHDTMRLIKNAGAQ